jgi:hypothetical protein
MNRSRAGVALAVCLVLASAHSLRADVKADERGMVKFEGTLGRIVNIFGGRAAREGVKSTVAVKANRKVTGNEQTAQISISVKRRCTTSISAARPTR